MRSAAHGAGWRRGRSYESSGRIPVPRPPEPTPESLAGVEGAGARDRGAPRPPSVTASDLAGSVRYAVGAAGAVALVLGVLQTQGAHALRERQCGRLVSLSWWAGTSGGGRDGAVGLPAGPDRGCGGGGQLELARRLCVDYVVACGGRVPGSGSGPLPGHLLGDGGDRGGAVLRVAACPRAGSCGHRPP